MNFYRLLITKGLKAGIWFGEQIILQICYDKFLSPAFHFAPTNQKKTEHTETQNSAIERDVAR